VGSLWGRARVGTGTLAPPSPAGAILPTAPVAGEFCGAEPVIATQTYPLRGKIDSAILVFSLYQERRRLSTTPKSSTKRRGKSRQMCKSQKRTDSRSVSRGRMLIPCELPNWLLLSHLKLVFDSWSNRPAGICLKEFSVRFSIPQAFHRPTLNSAIPLQPQRPTAFTLPQPQGSGRPRLTLPAQFRPPPPSQIWCSSSKTPDGFCLSDRCAAWQ
jgi:hypothetical protein